jgi:hypothetical protein
LALGARGSLFHWITDTGDGIRVVDVWQTREQFEQFAQHEIGPKTQEAGFPGPPAVVFHEAHNYMTAG